MPGATFKRRAEEWNRWTEEMLTKPFEATKNAIVRSIIIIPQIPPSMVAFQARGDYYPSFSSNRLEGIDGSQDAREQELFIKQTAGTMYAGNSSMLHSYLP